MRVELNIKEDKELRNYVKDIIRGMVKSVAREEIREITKEVFIQKTDCINKISVEKTLQQELRAFVKSKLDNGNFRNTSTLEKIAKEEIIKLVKDMFEKSHYLTK